MSTHVMNLEEVQRAMAAALMMPLTANEEMCTQDPAGRSMTELAASLIAPNNRLSAFERLEIYNRQYWFRVLNALAEDFPALRSVLGGRRFHALSVAYLVEHPSRSFTLRNLGSRLVEWLNAHPEFSGQRHALAMDVARIEWAFVEAFDSAECSPLTLEQIATLDGKSRFALQPHVQLLELQYPADKLVISLHEDDKRQASEAGVRDKDPMDPPVRLSKLRRRPTWVAAHRQDLSVYYRRLAREEYLTLQAIRAGQPLEAALEAGFAKSSAPAGWRARQVRTFFATWAELGWICAPTCRR